MDLLIIGGSLFLGRYLAEAALRSGHKLTLFNRGLTDPGAFPEAEHLRGDRDGDLSALEGRTWDAVIDTCGYVPRVVAKSAGKLASSVGKYVFISTISVYGDFSRIGMDEDAPLARMPEEERLKERAPQDVGEYYGALKVPCEEVVREAFPGRALIIRPGLVVGPHDMSYRFTYWVERVARGGRMLAPDPDQLLQFIDVRDLDDWTIGLVEQDGTGTFNATGPERALTFGRCLQECKAVSGSDAEFVWATDPWLAERGVSGVELPFWIPRSAEETAGVMTIDCRRAIDRGLTFRPLSDIVGSILEWLPQQPPEWRANAGMTQARESQLLELLRSTPTPGSG